MYNRAFLFNGIGSKPEKLVEKLTPELKEKYDYYRMEAFSRLGLPSDLNELTSHQAKTAEWLLPFICDRVVYEYYIDQGITPDIGMGYSSGIVIASACLGSIRHEDAHRIIMSHCSMLQKVEESGDKLDMGVIIGFSYDELKELFKDKFSPDELIIGSGNSSFHVMVCGKSEAVAKAVDFCTEEGAIKAFVMKTGTAFHYPVMKDLDEESIGVCKSLDFKTPVCPLMSVFDIVPLETAEQIRHENIINVYTPMRWDLALKKLEELGVKEFIDTSANGAVKKFSRVSRKCKIYTLEDVLSGNYKPHTHTSKKTKPDNAALTYSNSQNSNGGYYYERNYR